MPKLYSSRWHDFKFYLVAVAVTALAWGTQASMQYFAAKELLLQNGILGEDISTLTSAASKQLDAFLEINRLLTTLATALLGASFYLLVDDKKALAWQQRRWAAFVGAIFIAVSIFFGYVAYLFVIAMLRDGKSDVTLSLPHWAQQAHFYTFLAGVIFMADFIFSNLPKEKTSAK